MRSFDGRPPSNRTWMTDEHHDWIGQTAPTGIVGFTIDRAWANEPTWPLRQAVVKATIFDVRAGSLHLTRDHRPSHDASDIARASTGTGTGERADSQAGTSSFGQPIPTWGDGALRTLTFSATFTAEHLRAAGADARPPARFDFVLRARSNAGDAQPLLVSMVRVVKLGRANRSATVEEGASRVTHTEEAGGRFGDGVDMRGVVVLFVLAGLFVLGGCVLLVKANHTRCTLSGGGRRKLRAGTTMSTRGGSSRPTELEVRSVHVQPNAPVWPAEWPPSERT